MNVDITRTRVVHPSGIISPGRFVHLDGIAAVWSERTRVLYSSGEFVKAPSGRLPHRFITDSGEWLITRLAGGGCGCKKRNDPLGGLTAAQLTDPDFDSIP